MQETKLKMNVTHSITFYFHILYKYDNIVIV